LRKVILILLFFGCSYTENFDENKLNEFVKKTFKNYQLFEKPIIRYKYKNFLVIDFASAGATTNYSAIIIYKNNKFELGKLKIDNKIKEGIFVIGSGGAGRYSSQLKLENSILKLYEYSIYGEDNDYCKVEVYNFKNNIFEYDKKLSNSELKNYCKEVCSRLGIESKACLTTSSSSK